MRRPPIACRRAVQSLAPPSAQHIWVSDELLSSTFHRFFRNSCPHQKRHGSHVPGPLEAKRRAAKRRMTISANFHPQESYPSSFNLGALFGFRSNPQPSWKYEPPSLQRDGDPLDSSWNQLPPATTVDSAYVAKACSATPTCSSHRGTYSFTQNVAHILDDRETAAPPVSKEEHIVGPAITQELSQGNLAKLDYQACFEDFKARLADTYELSDKSINACLSKAHPKYHPDSHDAWKFHVLVFRHLLELGSDPMTILENHSVSKLSVPPIYSDESTALLMCLEELLSKCPGRLAAVHQIHTRMAKVASTAKRSYSAHGDSKLLYLVRQLWLTAQLQGVESEGSARKLLLVLTNKMESQTCSRMLRAILNNIKQAKGHVPAFLDSISENPGLLPAAARVLFCMPGQQLNIWVPSVSLNFAKTATSNMKIPQTKTRHRMHVWLQLLCKLDSEFVLHNGLVVDMTLRSFAKHVFAERTEVQARFQVLMSGLLVKASQLGAPKDVATMRIPDLLTSLETTLEQSGPMSVDAALGALISLLQQHNLPHEPLAGIILQTFPRHAGLEVLLNLMHVLDRRKLVLADSTPFQYAIEERVAVLRSRSERNKSTEKAHQHYTFALQACQKITDVLSRISSTPVFLAPELKALQAQRQFQYILARAESNHALPLAYRNITADISCQKRVDLIHQLAHQYSRDYTRSQREAWRAMYYLYKYLQQYSLPMGPLFSKSLVRISIVRPLSENRFVSARRLIWACHIVARVEGEDVVRKLETDFWKWRGDLIRHAKSVYIGVGGARQDKAHIGTMKKLGLI